MIDLGHWATGDYRIPAETPPGSEAWPEPGPAGSDVSSGDEPADGA